MSFNAQRFPSMHIVQAGGMAPMGIMDQVMAEEEARRARPPLVSVAYGPKGKARLDIYEHPPVHVTWKGRLNTRRLFIHGKFAYDIGGLSS